MDPDLKKMLAMMEAEGASCAKYALAPGPEDQRVRKAEFDAEVEALASVMTAVRDLLPTQARRVLAFALDSKCGAKVV